MPSKRTKQFNYNKRKKLKTTHKSNIKSVKTEEESQENEVNGGLNDQKVANEAKGEQQQHSDQYWAEKIVDVVEDKSGRKLYLIKWCDYDEKDNTWEPEKNVSHCNQLMEDFLITLNGRQPIKRSFEEIDKFCAYFRNIINETTDLQLISMVSNKPVRELYSSRVLREVKKSIQHHCSNVFAKMNRISDRNNKNRNAARDLMEYSVLKLVSRNFTSVSHFFDYYERREVLNTAMNEWSKKMNLQIRMGNEGTPISIENNVDFERPPEFNYITEYILDQKVAADLKVFDTKEDKAVYSCKCDNCYENRDECCSAVIGFPMVYTPKALLRPKVYGITERIFECNALCKCGNDCNNRVVQKGRKYKLRLFRTEKAMRGWGVKTLEKIPKGAFITEYTGEVISNEEAKNRPNTYFFNLGDCLDKTYSGDDEDFTYLVDAYNYGNIARFFNHSCNPNCNIMCVYVDTYDNCVPRLAIFAMRSIPANTELTYDYGSTVILINNNSIYFKNDVNDSSNACNDSSTPEANKTEDNSESASDEENGELVQYVNAEPNKSKSKLRRSESQENQSPEKIKCLCGETYCRGFLYN